MVTFVLLASKSSCLRLIIEISVTLRFDKNKLVIAEAERNFHLHPQCHFCYFLCIKVDRLFRFSSEKWHSGTSV